jgi:hypothetical protein
MHTPPRMKQLAMLLLAVTCFAAHAAAQESALFPRFSVTGGGYAGQFETTLRLDEEGFEGTEVTLERDLGLDDAVTLQRYSAQWRPFNRHELAASYFSSRRSGFAVIDREIVFRGTTYPVQATVTSGFDATLAEATYTYWAHKSERSGFGITLGAAAISLDAAIDARAPGGTVTIAQSARTDVPVALGGAQVRYAFTDRLHAEARAVALPRVTIDVYSGRALNAAARLEYRFGHVGIGAAYNYFRIDGSVTELDFSGDLSLTVRGPEAYLRLAY